MGGPEQADGAREGERLTALHPKVRAAGDMWGGADWQRLAERLAPVHDELVRRLGPRRGERWLDVGTGRGDVAVRAAAAGADVTGVDISEPLLAQARAAAGALSVSFDLGDAQRLPYEDASFDVVSSSFGVIFAPDVDAAAGELARVLRSGGRLGLTAWRPNERLRALYARFGSRGPATDADRWATRAGLEALLGPAFALAVSEGTWHLTGESPEALWELMSAAAPPLKAFLGTLDDDGRRGLRSAMLEYWESFRDGAGVVEPADYLLVLGTRR